MKEGKESLINIKAKMRVFYFLYLALFSHNSYKTLISYFAPSFTCMSKSSNQPYKVGTVIISILYEA